MKKYSIDWYIKYFTELPYELSMTAEYNPAAEPPKGDAWEWLDDEQQDNLYEIVLPYGLVIHVNDGVGMWRNVGTTPKERFLFFLKMIKKSRESIV